LKKNVLVLTYWSYNDPLIQTYTLPYVRIFKRYLPHGSMAYLFTLEQKSQKISPEKIRSIKEKLKQENIIWLPFKYDHFGLRMFFRMLALVPYLFWICIAKKIKKIHAWCTSGGGIGYILAMLTRIPLIIDSYEPHAECMVETGTWKRNSLSFKLLWWMEKRQSRHADTVIACVEKMKEYALRKYNATFKNFYCKPACVDFEMFSLKKRKNPDLLRKYGLEGKIVCSYVGKFGGIYLDQEIFDFFSEAEKFWGNKFRVVLLSNQDENQLREWSKKSNFDYSKIIKKFVPYTEVSEYMGLGDFGLSPYVPVVSRRYGSPIKNGEYWAMGLPIVIPEGVSDDSDIVRTFQIGSVLENLSKEAYLNSIKEIDNLLKRYAKEDLKRKIREVAIKYRNFKTAENVYQKIYDISSHAN